MHENKEANQGGPRSGKSFQDAGCIDSLQTYYYIVHLYDMVHYYILFVIKHIVKVSYVIPSEEKNDVGMVLVNMVIQDTQPFSIVEDSGFRKFVEALNPTYVLPIRQVCI
ncbi:hypothetical protein XENOCAPTIV_004586 [Xenoophorus captivus]|uniref:Uncharacterized protein n=1 Tax=Xenoophorus captivus TaxID=1517983 RepID=A0ABV0R6U9_9TELE